MTSFAEQVVDAYCDLARYPKDKLHKVNTPCLPEALATDEDLAKTGELNSVAAKVLMKALWLGRLARFVLYRRQVGLSRLPMVPLGG